MTLSLRQELDVRVADARRRLSRNDERILAFLRDHLDELAFHTAESLAQGTGVSAAAVVRFARRLGFESFRELRDRAREDLQGRARGAAGAPTESTLARKVRRDIENLELLAAHARGAARRRGRRGRQARARPGCWPTARPTGWRSTRTGCCTRCATTSGSSTRRSPIRCARSAPATR